MSRPRAPIDHAKESQSVLQGLKKEPPGWKRERLLALKLGLEGEASLEQIANAVGRARSTIQIWLDRYREGGLGRLMEVNRGKGPASELSEEAARDLQAGLAAGRWRTARQVREFLAKEHALKASLSAVYKYLGKAGARLPSSAPGALQKGSRSGGGVQGDAGAKARRA